MQKSAYLNQGINVAAQSYCDAPTDRAQSQAEAVLSRINTAIAHAEIAAGKAGGIAGKLLGEMLQSTCKDGPRPCRSGLMGEIQDRLDVLSDVLGVCDGHLNRLGDAI